MSVVADSRTELFHAQKPATVPQKVIATGDSRDNSAQIRSLLARHFLCWEGIAYMVLVHKACMHFWRAVKLWLCVSARLFWQGDNFGVKSAFGTHIILKKQLKDLVDCQHCRSFELEVLLKREAGHLNPLCLRLFAAYAFMPISVYNAANDVDLIWSEVIQAFTGICCKIYLHTGNAIRMSLDLMPLTFGIIWSRLCKMA